MKLFDTHMHLVAEQFDEDREQALRRANDAGVCLCLEAGTSVEYSRMALKLAQSHAGVAFSAGVHPQDAKDAKPDYLAEIQALLGEPQCVAIGEIGLDYHYETTPRDVQKRFFDEQIVLAVEMNKPLIVHDREAHQDVYEMLSVYRGKIRGVMHCYSGGVDFAKKYLDMGFYLGFDGPITFKNAKTPVEIVRYAPLDRLLSETDCPYLTPVPHRGERNEPMFIKHVVEAIASIKEISVEDAAEATYENGKRLFGIV